MPRYIRINRDRESKALLLDGFVDCSRFETLVGVKVVALVGGFTYIPDNSSS